MRAQSDKALRGKNMDLKAVLFDLGGTLVKTASPSEIIRRILKAHGIKRPIDMISVAHDKAEKNLTLEDYKLPYYDFWIKWNKIILEDLGILERTDFLARALAEEWWDNAEVELYPDVGETLIRLKEIGLKVGIITNGFKKDIEEILARLNLTDFFDVAVGIDAVKKPKPYKEIFLYALEKIKVQPHEALHVGDSLEKDYFGALNAGLNAILLDREDIVKENVVKIKNMGEILDLIGWKEPSLKMKP
jgi:putative hydrolase of the HAD superfamily